MKGCTTRAGDDEKNGHRGGRSPRSAWSGSSLSACRAGARGPTRGDGYSALLTAAQLALVRPLSVHARAQAERQFQRADRAFLDVLRLEIRIAGLRGLKNDIVEMPCRRMTLTNAAGKSVPPARGAFRRVGSRCGLRARAMAARPSRSSHPGTAAVRCPYKKTAHNQWISFQRRAA